MIIKRGKTDQVRKEERMELQIERVMTVITTILIIIFIRTISQV